MVEIREFLKMKVDTWQFPMYLLFYAKISIRELKRKTISLKALESISLSISIKELKQTLMPKHSIVV